MDTQISIHEKVFEIEYVFDFKVREKSGSRILLRYESCGEIKKVRFSFMAISEY